MTLNKDKYHIWTYKRYDYEKYIWDTGAYGTAVIYGSGLLYKGRTVSHDVSNQSYIIFKQQLKQMNKDDTLNEIMIKYEKIIDS